MGKFIRKGRELEKKVGHPAALWCIEDREEVSTVTVNKSSRDRFALVAGVYVWEASGVMIILGLYRLTDKSDLWAFLSRPDGGVFVLASLLFLCAGLLVTWKYRAVRVLGGSPLEFILRRNIMPVILVVMIVEGMLRVFSIDTEWGTLLGGKLLGPYRFEGAVARHSKQVSEAVEYDQLLGWTVKPNLNSRNGLYFTGPQGIRTPRPGMTFAGSDTPCRVALVGDSHTFGTELKFEATWGYHLERALPAGCQVLNFGVGGYSLGQMYLRYLHDVRPWHPDVVILALSSGSASRTMGVYGLNMFPRSIPWAQPRFQVKDQELAPINLPLPTPEALASARSMSDLPFIEYDWNYLPGRWDLPQWHYFYYSYLFRLYTTWFPIWRHEMRGASEESINHGLLRSFMHAAQSDEASLLVVYLPDKTDYERPVGKGTSSQQILRTSGIEYVDLLPCLNGVASNDRFLPHGDHYSLPASVAIADCVAPLLPGLGRQTANERGRGVAG